MTRKNPELKKITFNLTKKEEQVLINRAKILKQTPEKLVTNYFKALLDDDKIEDIGMAKLLKEVDWSETVSENRIMKALRR